MVRQFELFVIRVSIHFNEMRTATMHIAEYFN